MSLGNSPQAQPMSPIPDLSPGALPATIRNHLKLTAELSEVAELPGIPIVTPMKKANTTFTVNEPDDFALKIPARKYTGFKGRPPGLSGWKRSASDHSVDNINSSRSAIQNIAKQLGLA